MVEQFIDVRMASISIDEIANEQVNDASGESSFLGGLSGGRDRGHDFRI